MVLDPSFIHVPLDLQIWVRSFIKVLLGKVSSLTFRDFCLYILCSGLTSQLHQLKIYSFPSFWKLVELLILYHSHHLLYYLYYFGFVSMLFFQFYGIEILWGRKDKCSYSVFYLKLEAFATNINVLPSKACSEKILTPVKVDVMEEHIGGSVS